MKHSKRLLAALCAFAVAFSAFAAVNPFSSVADGGSGASEYKNGDVIFESGYDGAKIGAGRGKELHGHYSDMLPVMDGENFVIRSDKSWADHNYLYLGADYKTDKTAVAAQSITVKEGDVFTVEFKYKLVTKDATAFNSNFQMGICTTIPADYDVNYNTSRSNPQIIASADTADTDGWATYKGVFTVYEITKTGETPLDKLAIYTTMVHGREVYFDDVKVTYGGEAASVVFESDYNSAKIPEDNWAGNFTAFNSDMLPKADPDNSANTAIRLLKSGADYSYLYLGADYKGGSNEVAAQAMTVKKGDVFTVEFKYKVKTAGTRDDFRLGICTTVPATQTISKDEDNWANNKYIKNEELVLSGKPAVTSDWVSVKTVYTVGDIEKTPSTAGNPDVSINKLAIFAAMYHGAEIYIDDVKVTRGSGEETDKVIYDYDFTGAKECGDCWAGLQSSSGNAITVKEPGNATNMVLKNVSGVWGHGALLIGSKMNTNAANVSTAIKAEKGASYKVEFDYNLAGSNGVAYEVGIGVGPSSGHDDDQGPAYSIKQPILSYPAGTTFDGTWKKAEAIIEIPEDADFSNGEYLQLYFQNGQNGSGVYYYDNVKVTKLAKKDKGDYLANTDYEKAFTSGVRSAKPFTSHSNDALPVKDPDDTSNTVLEVLKNTSDHSYIYLGPDYASKSEVTKNSITAEPQAAYSIEFDYKIKEVDASGRHSSFKMGFCLAAPNTTEGQDQWGNNTKYSNFEAIFDNSTVAATDGWAHYSANYIIPSGADLTETNKLAIYITMYHGLKIYVDNVKVKKIDFVYTIKFDTNGGEKLEPLTGMPGDSYTLPETAVKEGCQFIGWFEDKDFTKPAESGTFSEEVKTIYAQFKKTQYIQSFEDEWANQPMVRSDWFEHLFVYNTSRKAGSVWESWSQWTDTSSTSYTFNPDGVRSGEGSIYGFVDGSPRVFTFLCKEPLVVGEEYTLSYWVKLEDYTIPGVFEIWFNNGDWNSGKLRTAVDWNTNKARSIRTNVNLSAMKDNMGEWLEVKVDFVANGKFVGLGVPPYSTCYIDDACITLKSADESISRTIDGEGLKFDEWFGQGAGDSLVYTPKDDTEEIIKIKYAPLEGLANDGNGILSGTAGDIFNGFNDSYLESVDNDNNKSEGGKKKYVVTKKRRKTAAVEPEYEEYFPTEVLIIAGAVLVAAGAVVTIVVIKKRKKKLQ